MLEEHRPNADQRATSVDGTGTARAVEIQVANRNYKAIASGRSEET